MKFDLRPSLRSAVIGPLSGTRDSNTKMDGLSSLPALTMRLTMFNLEIEYWKKIPFIA